MSFINEISNIKKQKISRVYTFVGTEAYFIEQFKSTLIASLNDQTKDEIHEFDLAETSIQDILIEAETLPFFNEEKIIFANNPVFLKAKPDKTSFTHDTFALESYLKNPSPFTYLVIIAPYEKLDGRKKISKELMKNSVEVPCNPISEYDLRKWISMLATENKIQIDPDAMKLIEQDLSTNLNVLESEIKKMATYVKEEGVVTEAVVKELMSVSANDSALELADAVLKKNFNEAIHLFKALEKNNEEAIALLALLAYQFRMILQVKLLLSKGHAENELGRLVKAHPYVLKLAASRSRKYSVDRLSLIMERLAETDARLKSGGMEKSLAFELLLYDLTK